MYRHFFKRFIDFILSLLALIFLSPLLLLTIIYLSLANKGNGIFFIQERPGKGAKIFRVIKFKTMTDIKDENGVFLPDSQRLTSVGKFIRSVSIDELPQLINILKGDMSFIGPRPLLIKYLPLYNEDQKKRHNVRPGLSGWAQINGRNKISWHQKFEYDSWYVENYNFKIDFKIFMATISKVFKKEGITSDTSWTTEPFTGNN